MVHYTELATKAEALITKFGRSITIEKFDTTPADASKPWRGPVDPRASLDATVATDGVFVEPSEASKLGMSVDVNDLLQRSEQIVIVSTSTDLNGFNELVDTDTTRWKILGFEHLKPGTVSLLYFIGVAR